MNKSDSIKNLAEALSNAQAEFSPAPENANNPHLRNKYADLGSIIETVKPILAKYGLSVSQLVEGHAGEIGVSNVLMHASGEWLESFVSMPVTDAKGINPAQAAGSIVSYLRRYSLAAMLGIYAGGDDDANGGNPTNKPAQTTQAPAPSKPAPQTPAPVQTNGHTNGNGAANPNNDKLEKAKLETSHDGTLYWNTPSSDLSGKTIGIKSALKKTDLTKETRAEYQRKLDAITTILDYRVSKKLPAGWSMLGDDIFDEEGRDTREPAPHHSDN